MRETVITEKYNHDIEEMYYKIAHKSGLDIYVLPKKLTTAYALFGTRFGAIDNRFCVEGQGETISVPDGVVHFLEHKLFENEDGSDTNERFARLGASANAFTSADMTAYEFSCTESFYPALAVLLDYVTHPYFTDENVEKEQGIIGQEIRGCEDNPNRCLYYKLLELLYERNNVRLNICGTVESISEITPDVLYSCYRTFYRLSNMALVVCGAIDHERVLEVADATLPVQEEVKIDRYYEAEPKNIVAPYAELKMGVARPLFAIGYKDNDYIPEGKEALRRLLTMRVLSELLFGTSTDFYGEMYADGLINSKFSAGYESLYTAGYYLVMGESDRPDEVQARLAARITSAKAAHPSHQDFERTKRAIYADVIRGFDSSESIAYEMLNNLFYGIDLLEVGGELTSLTYEETMTLLDAFFDPALCAMATVRPLDEDNTANAEER